MNQIKMPFQVTIIANNRQCMKVYYPQKSERASLSGSGKDKDEKKKSRFYNFRNYISITYFFVLCHNPYVFFSNYTDTREN